jgi:hypothetical protein
MAMTGKSYARRSYRTPEEIQVLLHGEVSRLNPEEMDVLTSAIGDEALMAALLEMEYDEIPVSPKQFLEDDRYYGMFGASMHAPLQRDFADLFTDGYDEVVLSGSLGWGKSYFSTACIIYDAYKTLCLRDPQQSYGLAPRSRILSAVISLSIEHARLGVLEDISTRVLMMPIFREKFPCTVRKSGLFFLNKNLVILPENYAAQRIIGLNVYSAFIDEANFAKGGKSAASSGGQSVGKAKAIYESVMNRRKSRYMVGGRVPGMCIIVSSATVQSAFTVEKVREAEKNPNIFVRNYATWDVKPDQFNKGVFYVLVASGGKHCRILTDEEAKFYQEKSDLDPAISVVPVPTDYRDAFDTNLIGSLREIAGIPAEAVTHLFPDSIVVDRAEDPGWGPELQHGFTTKEWECEGEGGFVWERLCERRDDLVGAGYSESQWRPKIDPEALRFAHIDTSVNGDATGICVGHVHGYTEVVRRDSDLKEYTEIAPRIIIDFELRILPPPGGDIRLGAVRALLYEMQDHGFVFALVTTDGYQSVDTRQKLEQHGIKAELASMDRDDVPYMKLQSAYMERRVKRVPFPHLTWELTNLIHDRAARKVDHPSQMVDNRLPSKDVSDAECGVVAAIELRRPGMRSMQLANSLEVGTDDDDDRWVTGGRRLAGSSDPFRRM